MYFDHTYKHKVSYLAVFLSYVAVGVAIYLTIDHPYWYIISTIALTFAFFLTYQTYSYNNKLVIGMNEEGVCIWQKRNYYLFCPWEAIEHVAVRKEWRPTQNNQNNNQAASGQWVKYIDISYKNGTVWYVYDKSTYIKKNQDVHLRILEEHPSTDTYHYLYETNIEHTVETMAQAIIAMKEQYLKNRGYTQSYSHEHCKCTQEPDIDYL